MSNFFKAVSVSSLAIISCSLNSVAQTGSPNAIEPNAIRLTYSASQIQCSADSSLINVQVHVYRNQQFFKTLSLNDSLYLPINSFNDLSFEYDFKDTEECTPKTPTEMVLAPEDPVPNLPGAYDQDSIQQMLKKLNEYEELFLVELGTTNPDSSAYDLQDVVMIIDNDPEPPD